MKSWVSNASYSILARFTGAARIRWLAFATASLVAAAPTLQAASIGDGIRIGETLPNFSAIDQAGNSWSLSQETDKVVILHACALWCTPCRNLSLGLNEVIALLEDEFGPETFEVVEVLLSDFDLQTSDQRDAAEWAAITGGGLTVLHSDGDPNSDVAAFAQAVAGTVIPQLIILDSRRRVADVRAGLPNVEEAFREAILHGLAVSEFPTDLSYDWQGPTKITLESLVRSGNGEFSISDTKLFLLAEFTDDMGLDWFSFFSAVESTPGSLDFWNRVENHQIIISPTSLNATPETVTLKLSGYLWYDGYPRVARPAVGVNLVAPDLQSGSEITGVEAEVSADGILTVGPIAVTDPWAQLQISFQVGALWAVPKTLTELVQELIEEIESVGLSTGSTRSLVQPLGAAAALLGDDNLANDVAGLAALRAVADRLRREDLRDVPSELAALWAVALDALTE